MVVVVKNIYMGVAAVRASKHTQRDRISRIDCLSGPPSAPPRPCTCTTLCRGSILNDGESTSD